MPLVLEIARYCTCPNFVEGFYHKWCIETFSTLIVA